MYLHLDLNIKINDFKRSSFGVLLSALFAYLTALLPGLQ